MSGDDFMAAMRRASASFDAEIKARRRALGDLADYLGRQAAGDPDARRHHELALTLIDEIDEFDNPSKRKWGMRMAGPGDRAE